MKALNLVKVRKKFGDILAVDDMTLEVKKGSFFTLLGPSGCGKSTTLRIVAGLTKPDHGEVYIDGSNVTDSPPYLRKVGMVFQNYALFPHLTVHENIAFGLKVRNYPKEERNRLVEEVLRLVNLSGLGERLPKELSGGEQQRVAVARAIVITPAVLLLDEPLSNLDLRVRVAMRREIRNLTRRLGITTLNVTHDQGEALSMSDVIGVMDMGRLMQIGTPREIYERPTNQFVAGFIGEANFLEAKVSEFYDQYALINVSDALTVYAKLNPGEGDIQKLKSSRTLYIRPEKVAVSRHKPDGKNVFLGSIEDMEYFGSFVRCTVKVGEVKLSCEVTYRDSGSFERGEKVYISFDPEDCVLS